MAPHPARGREQLLDKALPQFEQFIESREKYIKALETTIAALRKGGDPPSPQSLAIRDSLDELMAMQRLSSTISTTLQPDAIVSTLIELTRSVVPVVDCNIYLFESGTMHLMPLSSRNSLRLQQEVQQQLEGGIVDWVVAEKKTVVIPDLNHLLADGPSRNYVIVPLILRNEAMGIYVIQTEKQQQDFTSQDIQLLTVLANQAAAGVENWRTHEQLSKVNAELKASQSTLLQAAKMAALGELSANILHEIKNPVQILKLTLDALERGHPVAHWEQVVARQAKRLSDMIARLMTFARVTPNEEELGPVDVNAPIIEMVAIVKDEFANGRITIELNLSPDLPQVRGNHNALWQVFLNLLINARDAMPEGGRIAITSSHIADHLSVKVSDTGVGIPPEHMPKIFDAFFTTKDHTTGTGLGLSICQKIIAQHKGEIRVESEVRKGTTFTIVFPLRRIGHA
jgi:signal transduction histidine kinase